jgi:FtsH-binding integral membrane protein
MNQLATEAIAAKRNDSLYFTRTFGWMATGLAVTGGIAYLVGNNPVLLQQLVGAGMPVFIGLLIVELLLVMGLVKLVQHMNLFEAAAIFLGYAALNGLTFSVIFAVFTTQSIFSTFLVTAGMFGFLALWGATTKRDLTSWGNLLLAALVGQLIGLFVNFFWFNETLYWVTTATGVLIFSAYTAYDVQKLKQYEVAGDPRDPAVEKAAIVGALALYLDFVNLFLYLLRLLGRRK